jgi:hypothetical protein
MVVSGALLLQAISTLRMQARIFKLLSFTGHRYRLGVAEHEDSR